MDVDPVANVPSPRRPMQSVGVTAELAEARSKLRLESPPGRWDAVLAEVQRLQTQEHMAPLAAIHKVHARLAAGWVPPLVR